MNRIVASYANSSTTALSERITLVGGTLPLSQTQLLTLPCMHPALAPLVCRVGNEIFARIVLTTEPGTTEEYTKLPAWVMQAP